VELTSPLPATENFDDALVNDMALWAQSGLGFLTREIDDDWQLGAPCLPITRQASMLAGIATATAAVAATLEDASAPPRHIKLDQLELLALMPMQPIAFAQLEDRIVGRPDPDQPPVQLPGGTMPTANGMAYVRPVEPAHWNELLQLVGNLDWLAWMIEDDPSVLTQARGEVDKRIRDWALSLRSEQLSDLCQAEHVPVAPIYRPDEVLNDEHHKARGFFRDTNTNPDEPDALGSARVHLPFLASVVEPASESLGSTSSAEVAQTVVSHPRLRSDAGNLPLAGVRILDRSWAWAGPFATTLMAALGAEVINVEWHPRASNLRRNPPFAQGRDDSHNTAAWWSANHRGKLSIGVDMKSDQGKSIIRDLAAQCDVVVENFSPGTVDRLGVGFSDLVQVNSRLVYVSLSAFGQSGPHSHYIGYGNQVHGSAGACYATSQDGETLSQMYIPLPDPISGLAGAFAIAAYVRNARATGRAALIDVSEVEAVAATNLEPFLNAFNDGSSSYDQTVSVQYIVISTADEEFVALLARQPDNWDAFHDILGSKGTSREDIQDAARILDSTELLARASAAKLDAVVIQDSRAVLNDPHLANFWEADQSPEVAPTGVTIGGTLWHIDGQRAQIWRGAPPLFNDTRAVLGDLLSYPAPDIEKLFTSGVVM
jgi:crotonobetainyl-CoA:carnitine CoA-transferase CaiB-like acyl-CoA transferase